jgi:hypothetical protein
VTTTHQGQQQRTEVSSGALPQDGMGRFVRVGAWVAMVSGVALAVSLLVDWLVVPHERLGSEAFLTGSYLASSGLRLLSIALLPWALIGIYERQSRSAGAFGLWAFAVVFLGATLTVGNAWAEVFVWPTLAQAAPGMMSGSVTDMSSYLVAGLNVSFPLFGIGLILFGVATFRAGVYPRWASALLVVSIPVTMFLDPTPGTFQESIGQILLGTSVAALGLHALRTTPSSPGGGRRSPTGQSPQRPVEDAGVPPDSPGRKTQAEQGSRTATTKGER